MDRLCTFMAKCHNDGDVTELPFAQEAYAHLEEKRRQLKRSPPSASVVNHKRAQRKNRTTDAKGESLPTLSISCTPSLPLPLPIVTPDASSGSAGESPTDALVDKQANTNAGPADRFLFYQSANADRVFLHPVNVKMLGVEFGSLEDAPHILVSKIVDIEEMESGDAKERYRFLGYMPRGVTVTFVEVDLSQTVSQEVMDQFRDQLDKRKKRRSTKKKKERTQQRKTEERLAQEYDYVPRFADDDVSLPFNDVEFLPKAVPIDMSRSPPTASRSFLDVAREDADLLAALALSEQEAQSTMDPYPALSSASEPAGRKHKIYKPSPFKSASTWASG